MELGTNHGSPRRGRLNRRGANRPVTNKLAFSDIKRGFLSRVQTHQAYSAIIEYEPEVSNMEEYPAVVDRMRVYLLLVDD